MKYIVSILVGVAVMLLIWHCGLAIRVTNLEKQQLRIEQEYQRVITQNEQLKRVNNQDIRLLAEGGWYRIVDIPDDSTDN